MPKPKRKIVRELNLLIDQRSDQFVAAAERLKEITALVERHAPNSEGRYREGFYTVDDQIKPVDVFFFGFFRSGLYGFCTCDFCQENESVCFHIVAALKVYIKDRQAVKCSNCKLYRLPEDLAPHGNCVICLNKIMLEVEQWRLFNRANGNR